MRGTQAGNVPQNPSMSHPDQGQSLFIFISLSMVASPGLIETGDADNNIDYLKFDKIYRASYGLWMGSFLKANIFLVVQIYIFGIFSGKAYTTGF